MSFAPVVVVVVHGGGGGGGVWVGVWVCGSECFDSPGGLGVVANAACAQVLI